MTGYFRKMYTYLSEKKVREGRAKLYSIIIALIQGHPSDLSG